MTQALLPIWLSVSGPLLNSVPGWALPLTYSLEKYLQYAPKIILALQARLALALTEDKYLVNIKGKIISMSVALRPVATCRLMTRGLYTLIDAQQMWCEALKITDNAKSDLQFWLTEIQHFNGQNI